MRNLEDQASKCMLEAGISGIPVPLEQIAKKLGAVVSFEPFGGHLSGMLYRDTAQTVIGINSAHPHRRQRFTIAHEIGHFGLHKVSPVIVDRATQEKLVRVNTRNEASGQGTDQEESEANQFAAALLMPREVVMREVQHRVARTPDAVRRPTGSRTRRCI
jgi:Zn-dependent peptidase ImmA (M78 family)